MDNRTREQKMTVAQGLAPEVRWLAARMNAERKFLEPRCWGRSSDAMALYGLGEGPRPTIPGRMTAQIEMGRRWAFSTKAGGSWSGDECGRDYPADMSDLNACERTYEMAPLWVQERMRPVLEEFRQWVLHGVNRYGERIQAGATWGTHEPARSM